MIRIHDEKYGNVLIYEKEDLPYGYDIDKYQLIEDLAPSYDRANAHVISFRDIKKGKVKILKNRYGSLDDIDLIGFILNIGVKEKEKIDPITSRFEILDIR